MAEAAPSLQKLQLDALWRARGAKFGGFAGYDMPLTFEGLIAEHNWTRTHASLFDVSHMGPTFFGLPEGHGLHGDAAHARIVSFIEQFAPADLAGMKPGQVRYTMLLNAEGGVLDDIMVSRPEFLEESGDLLVVVNAGRKHEDWALLEQAVGADALMLRVDDRGLLALQGPSAAGVAAALIDPGLADLGFMEVRRFPAFGEVIVTRSGYTGEDGYEILVAAGHAQALAEALLAHPEVKPAGLGARDSLRLEAGLCLYGHDLDESTSPIEADLAWSIQKRRRETQDFPGAGRILHELKEGPSRRRVGIRPKDRAPARENTPIHVNGAHAGIVTSGGFSPTLNAPISMGYVAAEFSAPGTEVELIVRGQPRPAEIVALPFVPHRYHRKGKSA